MDQDEKECWKKFTKQCSPRLSDLYLLSLELFQAIPATKYRGEFEKRLQSIIKEFISEAALFTILILDEIHTLEGAR